MKNLIAAHKVLIFAALGLALLLVAWGLWRGERALATSSAGAALVAALYLRRVYRKYP